MRLTTLRGYDLFEASSALQKAIRRNDARLAGYFAIEIFEGGFVDYVWRRLLTISAEDCAGPITTEVWNLYEGWRLIDKNRNGAGRIFVAKAVLLLCAATKSRDADHLTNLVHDARSGIDDDQIDRELAAVRADTVAIPQYALDYHTSVGRRRGLTRRDFFIAEHDALAPARLLGFFDDDAEALRAGDLALADGVK